MVGAVLLATACAAGAAVPVHISLAAKPSSITAGRAWTATLTARPRSFAGVVQRVGRRAAKAQRPRDGRPRHLPRAHRLPVGRTLDAQREGGRLDVAPRDDHGARAGAEAADLHLADVDRPAAGWIAARRRERRRTHRRVSPSTGRGTTVASGLSKPYAVATTASGTIYLSNGGSLQRIEGEAPVNVLDAGAEVGPVAVRRAAASLLHDGVAGLRARRRRAGVGPERAARHRRRSGRRGARVRPGNGRVLRVDPQTHATTTLIRTGEPRGIDVAVDGSLYIVEATAKRVGHYSATGTRLGDVGPVFNDPYDVEVGTDGRCSCSRRRSRGRSGASRRTAQSRRSPPAEPSCANASRKTASGCAPSTISRRSSTNAGIALMPADCASRVDASTTSRYAAASAITRLHLVGVEPYLGSKAAQLVRLADVGRLRPVRVHQAVVERLVQAAFPREFGEPQREPRVRHGLGPVVLEPAAAKRERSGSRSPEPMP